MTSSALRIRVRCPSVSSAPVQLEGCTSQTTFAELQGLVLVALGLESGGNGDTTHQPPTILAGFPPRPLELPQDAAIGSVLSDNENVTVRLATQPAGVANPEGGKWGRGRSKRATATTTSSTSTRASTRASTPPTAGNTAAGGAGCAPPMQAENSKGKGKASGKMPARSSGARGTEAVLNGTGGGRSGSGGGGSGVHTLAGRVTPPPPRSGGSSRAVAAGGSAPGQVRTLFGSGTLGATGSSPTREAAAAATGARDTGGSSRKRARAGTKVDLKSEGDIAERLLQAVGGGGKGTADRFFRKAMKLAVDKQYDQSRADARVRAALGGWYTTEASAMQRRLGDGESVALKISFSKGDGAKSQFEETVDRISPAQVAAVVRMVARDPESREMLKPHNFAGCSPRMFWSLVQHWGGDVPRALRLAAPDVDWSFVDTRDRKPSEKAVANAMVEEAQRQEAEEERAEKEKVKEAKRRKRERNKRRREGIQTDSSDDNPETPSSTTTGEPLAPAAAAAAVNDSSAEAVSEERLAAATAADARQRAANAALARLASSQSHPRPEGVADGIGVATSAAARVSMDASEEPHRQGTEREEDGVDMEGLTEVAGEAGATLLVAAGVRTLGQLADREEEELTRELGVVQEGGTSTGERSNAAVRVSAEEVSEWVQGAREEELDEIMLDIVGGNEDVVEALEEVAVSTPRDLVRLGSFPDVLVGAVRDRMGAERFATLENCITVETVEAWRRKGDRLLEQRPWLELWVHEG